METIEINGKTWYSETSFGEPISSNLCKSIIGQYVICRTRNEGVNFGKVREADETGVILDEARRLWRHSPADESTSWYEGVALHGMKQCSENRISSAVTKYIFEDYSLTVCTQKAIQNLQEYPTNEQS